MMNFCDQNDFQIQDYDFQIQLNKTNSRISDDFENFFDFDLSLQKKESVHVKRDSIIQIQQQVKQHDVIEIREQQIFASSKSNASNSTKSDSPSQLFFRKCSCTRTRCLKNYCECFKLGIKCNEECQCRECRNNVQLFLLPSNVTVERVKCKCQKSKCSKKYCECHSAGKKCGKQCNCTNCQNSEQMQEEKDEIRKRVKSDPLLQYEQYLN